MRRECKKLHSLRILPTVLSRTRQFSLAKIKETLVCWTDKNLQHLIASHIFTYRRELILYFIDYSEEERRNFFLQPDFMAIRSETSVVVQT